MPAPLYLPHAPLQVQGGCLWEGEVVTAGQAQRQVAGYGRIVRILVPRWTVVAEAHRVLQETVEDADMGNDNDWVSGAIAVEIWGQEKQDDSMDYESEEVTKLALGLCMAS